MKPRNLVLIVFLLAASLALPLQAGAQARIEDASVEAVFGEQLLFRARLFTDSPVESAAIHLQPAGAAQPQVEAVTVNAQETYYNLLYILDISNHELPPFSTLSYWYEVRLENGETFTGPVSTYRYEDNRFSWRELERGPFKLRWYAGDLEYARSVLDIARRGEEHIQELLQVNPVQNVMIYVYDTAADMQSSLARPEEEWIAAHTDPGLGVIVLAAPAGPEQTLRLEQRLPHEMMHLMLFQAVGQAITNLPIWLQEGVASAAELYPNPDYQILLENARSSDGLMPIASLCQAFPPESAPALLAYAESASFTRYLFDRFGSQGVQGLISAYARGEECEQGVQKALGISLAQLEREWRKDQLNENLALAALEKLLPWLVLLAAVLAAPAVLIASRLRGRRRSLAGSANS